MNPPTLSFICPANNQQVLNEMLIASLKKQKNQDYELIVIDAKKQGFKSAWESLNYGASLAKGKYLCFCHQDIEFLKDDAVDKIIHFFEDYEFGFAGIAGPVPDRTARKGYRVHSSVTMMQDHRQAGLLTTEVEECRAVDECAMFCKKDHFKGFDDYGATWHFYGVEYSQRCIDAHEKVLLFPIEVYHLSGGDFNKSFFETLLRYAKRNKKTKVLVSCCGVWKNNALLPLYCFIHKHRSLSKFGRAVKSCFKRKGKGRV